MNGRSQVVIVGGGPGGYEAALVAAHLGARVTVVDRDGLGGAAVFTDCVPSKALIATADYLGQLETWPESSACTSSTHEGDEMVDAVGEPG
jgi:pyruvate/2-oxoglutarate dehydrogenase complex dihydrolipoamide dehydrogenase (E3) component